MRQHDQIIGSPIVKDWLPHSTVVFVQLRRGLAQALVEWEEKEYLADWGCVECVVGEEMEGKVSILCFLQVESFSSAYLPLDPFHRKQWKHSQTTTSIPSSKLGC